MKTPFTLREQICVPGSPTKPNEDAFAVNAEAGTAIVIDGLTSKAEESFLCLNDQSDVSWASRTLAERFNNFSKHQIISDPVKVLNFLRKDLRQNFDALTKGEKPEMLSKYPMAAVAILRVREDIIELTNIGDTEIGIQTQDNQTFWLHKDAGHVRSEEARKPLINQLMAQGIVTKAELREHVLPLMRQQYNEGVNRDGGFGMFSLDRDIRPQDTKRVLIPRAQIKQIFMATDGLTAYFEPYGFAQYADLNHVLGNENPLKQMITAVRELENKAKETDNIGSFKRSDDATGLILQF